MITNHLASSGVDRAAHLRRSEPDLAALRAHPDARVLVVRPPYVLVAEGPAALAAAGRRLSRGAALCDSAFVVALVLMVLQP